MSMPKPHVDLPPRPDWMLSGLCSQVDPDLFFPGPKEVWTAKRARRLCAGCPVRWACLEYALDNDMTDGIWSGTTPEQRRKLKRERGAA